MGQMTKFVSRSGKYSTTLVLLLLSLTLQTATAKAASEQRQAAGPLSASLVYSAEGSALFQLSPDKKRVDLFVAGKPYTTSIQVQNIALPTAASINVRGNQVDLPFYPAVLFGKNTVAFVFKRGKTRSYTFPLQGHQIGHTEVFYNRGPEKNDTIVTVHFAPANSVDPEESASIDPDGIFFIRGDQVFGITSTMSIERIRQKLTALPAEKKDPIDQLEEILHSEWNAMLADKKSSFDMRRFDGFEVTSLESAVRRREKVLLTKSGLQSETFAHKYNVEPDQRSAQTNEEGLPTGIKLSKGNDETIDAATLVESFAVDLVQTAKKENWPYVNDPELRRLEDLVLEAFLRPEAGSAALLGEQGVGKDKLLDRIAVRIAKDDVPESLKGIKLWRFSAGSLVAGTNLRGQAESRSLAVVEISKHARIIWHIQNSAQLMDNDTAFLDEAKPFLARGKMRLIFDDTPERYDHKVGSDSAIQTYFTKVSLPIPDPVSLRLRIRAWWGQHARGLPELSDAIIDDVVRLSDLYAPSGVQPSRSTSLLNALVSARGVSGSLDPITYQELQKTMIKLWSVPAQEFDPALQYQSYDALEADLALNVIGHDLAKRVVLQSKRNEMAHVENSHLPRLRLILVGPKGIGKTAFASIVAKHTGNGGEPERLLMSQYAGANDVEKFEADLAEKLSHGGAFCLIFFDEFEKAHINVQNAMLAIWDAGEFRPHKSGKEDGKNSSLIRVHNNHFIAAGNAGAAYIEQLASRSANESVELGFGRSGSTTSTEDALGRLKNSFEKELSLKEALIHDNVSPFIVDRADDVMVMAYPTLEQFQRVIALHLRNAINQWQSNAKIKVDIPNLDKLAQDVGKSLYRFNLSNRDALRMVTRLARNTVADIQFDWSRRQLQNPAEQRKPLENLQLHWNAKSARLEQACSAIF